MKSLAPLIRVVLTHAAEVIQKSQPPASHAEQPVNRTSTLELGSPVQAGPRSQTHTQATKTKMKLPPNSNASVQQSTGRDSPTRPVQQPARGNSLNRPMQPPTRRDSPIRDPVSTSSKVQGPSTPDQQDRRARPTHSSNLVHSQLHDRPIPDAPSRTDDHPRPSQSQYVLPARRRLFPPPS